MTRNFGALLVTLFMASAVSGQGDEQAKRIAEAVLPLPVALRVDATVMAYEADAQRSILRKGTNDWMCFADEPTPGFSVLCYHTSLDDFLHGNRVLSAQGKSQEERNPIRQRELESGALVLPEQALAFTLMGNNRQNALSLTTVWIPFAIAESTGLPTEPDSHRPWLMNAGSIGAHIMFPGS